MTQDDNLIKMRRTLRFPGLVPASRAVSEVKSAVRARDTTPEILLRAALWKRELRYRVAPQGLLGRPDIVFVRQRVAVLYDGGKDRPERRGRLATRHPSPYWIVKIEANTDRDICVTNLRDEGWRILRFWESDIAKDLTFSVAAVERIFSYLVESPILEDVSC